ncbi:hypothetical protein B0H14DRAFT_3515764 [Mycena olivaceomarginata]|nr:hypothetical protein B0H14DRAFT_3515764 [Mycena olivaceomarginata]
MAQRNAPITCLASETLSDIFLYTLPSRPPLAPLLLCQISSRFREIAVADPRLWRSLCTEKIVNPQLMEVWLKRAGDISLSLRIARALGPVPTMAVGLHQSIYLAGFELYLAYSTLPPYLAPQNLAMSAAADASFLALESLSVTIQRTNLPAARWLSHALGRAPRLTRFHWSGPAVAAPWAQLSHLSLDVEPFGPGLLKSVLDAATHGPAFTAAFRVGYTPPTNHVGSTLGYYLFNWPTSNADDSDLPSFLQHSQCAITTLEVSHSLRRLVIGAHGLCQFFGWLEHHTPGTLPHNLRLLREVDLCFRIDDRPAAAMMLFLSTTQTTRRKWSHVWLDQHQAPSPYGDRLQYVENTSLGGNRLTVVPSKPQWLAMASHR